MADFHLQAALKKIPFYGKMRDNNYVQEPAQEEAYAEGLKKIAEKNNAY